MPEITRRSPSDMPFQSAEVVEYKLEDRVYTTGASSARPADRHFTMVNGPCSCGVPTRIGVLGRTADGGPWPVTGLIEYCPQCDRAWPTTDDPQATSSP